MTRWTVPRYHPLECYLGDNGRGHGDKIAVLRRLTSGVVDSSGNRRSHTSIHSRGGERIRDVEQIDENFLEQSWLEMSMLFSIVGLTPPLTDQDPRHRPLSARLRILLASSRIPRILHPRRRCALGSAHARSRLPFLHRSRWRLWRIRHTRARPIPRSLRSHASQLYARRCSTRGHA